MKYSAFIVEITGDFGGVSAYTFGSSILKNRRNIKNFAAIKALIRLVLKN